MESVSLDIMIATYLAVVRDDEIVQSYGRWEDLHVYPARASQSPVSQGRKTERESLNFLRKTTLTFLILLEQPAVNTKMGQGRMEAIVAARVQNQATHSAQDLRKGGYDRRGDDDHEI